jgi:ABC-type lipoprotein export system ATPase subunit
MNEEGTTIIQVTHSDINAEYGSRVINLKDGLRIADYWWDGYRRRRVG